MPFQLFFGFKNIKKIGIALKVNKKTKQKKINKSLHQHTEVAFTYNHCYDSVPPI